MENLKELVEEKKKKILNVRVSAQFLESLKQRCSVQKETISTFLRRAIDAEMSKLSRSDLVKEES